MHYSEFSPLLAKSFGQTTAIRIPNVSATTFNNLLLYKYGLEIPDFWKNISHTKEIIEAADKYGITNLKLEAEARYVKSTKIAFGNVMDHLLFAESKNCALLKEAVMDVIVQNKILLDKKTLKDTPAGHMNDILAAIARGERECRAGSNESKFSAMHISELRGRAHVKGLDVDGSREALISALENASGKKRG